MSLSEPLVSIVVPVYNVERYLARSIQSIKNQTYHNLQIILIDDGATDSSGTICDVQAATDNRIEVFHSENQGVAEARNLGLKHVRGEYLIFVDPDDFVGPEHVNNLFKAITSSPNSLLAVTGGTRFYNDQKTINAQQGGAPNHALSPVEAFAISIGSSTTPLFFEYPWGKIYKKELFPLMHYPKGRLFEDRYVNYKTMLNAHIVVYENSNDYFYLCDRPDSITNSVDLSHLDCLQATREMLDYANREHPEASPYVFKRYCGELVYFYGLASKFNDAKIENELYEEIIDIRKEVLSSKHSRLSTKIGYASSYLGKWFFKSAIYISDACLEAVAKRRKKSALSSD